MSQTPYEDLYTQVAEEFNVERAFVNVIAREILMSGKNDGPFPDVLRKEVQRVLDLIDKSEES
jgi:hypothetical protein